MTTETEHEEAVRAVRKLANSYSASELQYEPAKLFVGRLHYVAAMADWALVLENALLELSDSYARIEALEKALGLAQRALRAPLDDWRGELERIALNAIQELSHDH